MYTALQLQAADSEQFAADQARNLDHHALKSLAAALLHTLTLAAGTTSRAMHLSLVALLAAFSAPRLRCTAQ